MAMATWRPQPAAFSQRSPKLDWEERTSLSPAMIRRRSTLRFVTTLCTPKHLWGKCYFLQELSCRHNDVQRLSPHRPRVQQYKGGEFRPETQHEEGWTHRVGSAPGFLLRWSLHIGPELSGEWESGVQRRDANTDDGGSCNITPLAWWALAEFVYGVPEVESTAGGAMGRASHGITLSIDFAVQL